MSNIRPQHRSMGDSFPQQHPTSGTDFSNLVSTPPPPDLTPYIIKTDHQYVAGGGFGDVYRCQYLRGSTSQQVAVKALRFKFTLDGDTKDKSIKMLRRELGVWKRLRHNNVVPFMGIAYGFGMDGTMSLVSLWMSNDTLHKFLAMHDDKLDVVHRLQILFDIAKGLDYLHSFPIVHGDLNSNNVLLDADYTARLADFGYASCVGDIPEALGYLRRSTARPGAWRWIAPEQIDLEGPFIRTTGSDIYSFGCIALEVLSGKQPWSEVREDAAVVLHLHLGHQPARPGSRIIDDSHWNVIQRCWSPLRKRPSADIIILSIQRFLSDYPPSGPLRDLFISLSSRAQDSLSGGLSLGLTAARPLEATMSPLNPPNPPPAQDRPSRPTDLAVSVTNSSALRARHKMQNGSMDGPRAMLNVFKFRVLATELWNRIKPESSAPTMDISENDIVVFVVGPTGSGKSWFTNAATNCSLVKVSRDQHPFAGNVRAIRCELADEAKRDLQAVKNIVFVDSPSFLTEYDNSDPHKEFKAWFNKIVYKPRYVGVIYMHSVEIDPALQPISAHLREFSNIRRIGDAHHPQRLLVVVSYDKTSRIIAEPEIRQCTSDLHNQVNLLRQSTGKWQPSSIHKERFQGEPEVAWRAVEELFRNL